jgi:hypothetical protein
LLLTLGNQNYFIIQLGYGIAIFFVLIVSAIYFRHEIHELEKLKKKAENKGDGQQ